VARKYYLSQTRWLSVQRRRARDAAAGVVVKSGRRLRAREKNEARFGAEYFAAVPGSSWCVYCGLVATGLDHVPALSVRARRDVVCSTGWLYPCCGWCNAVLGAVDLECLVLRSEFALSRLRCRWLAELNEVRRGQIATLGKAIRARVDDRSLLALCRCRECCPGSASESA